jgi:hypothetical protein
VQPEQGRLVRCNGHDNGTPKAFLTQVFFKKILHFSSAFTDEPDDIYLGFRIARNHAEQHAFANAAAREDAHPLAFPTREARVNRPNAEWQRLGDTAPLHGVDGFSHDGIFILKPEWSAVVYGNPVPIDDPSEQSFADTYGQGPVAGLDDTAGSDAPYIAERNHERLAVPEADDLRESRLSPVPGMNGTYLAEREAGTGGLDYQAGHSCHLPAGPDQVSLFNGRRPLFYVGQYVHFSASARSDFRAALS